MASRSRHPMYTAPTSAGTRTSMFSGDRLTVRSVYAAAECVDEFECVKDAGGVVRVKEGGHVVRKWRSTAVATTGMDPETHAAAGAAAGGWTYEFGEPAKASGAAGGATGIAESHDTPFIVRRNTPGAWEFRIRNLRYPAAVYFVSIDSATQEIVLRTSNKKYFKRLDIPAMIRAGLPLQEDAVSFEHDGVNTLVIRYAKPERIVREEAVLLETAQRSARDAKDGVDCKTQ